MTNFTLEDGLSSAVDFWFGTLDADGLSLPEKVARWWKKDPELDDEIRRKFCWLHAALATSDGSESLKKLFENREHALGAIIVLDQFSRNMFRDTLAMYCTDPQAAALSHDLISRGVEDLPRVKQSFIYMPLMHSEQLIDQDRCVGLFASLAESADGSQKKAADAQLKYAILHRDIVARFGRFPHRNEILARPSTEEELAFLKEPGSSF